MLAPSTITLNVGLDTNEGGSISAAQALAAIRMRGGYVRSHTLAESDTELTLIAILNNPMNPDKLHQLSVDLQQDCIAMAVGSDGELYGPKAEAWGPFNPEYFLTITGTRLADRMAA